MEPDNLAYLARFDQLKTTVVDNAEELEARADNLRKSCPLLSAAIDFALFATELEMDESPAYDIECPACGHHFTCSDDDTEAECPLCGCVLEIADDEEGFDV